MQKVCPPYVYKRPSSTGRSEWGHPRAFFRLNKPTSLSISSSERFSSPLINFIAHLWTLPSSSASFLWWRPWFQEWSKRKLCFVVWWPQRWVAPFLFPKWSLLAFPQAGQFWAQHPFQLYTLWPDGPNSWSEQINAQIRIRHPFWLLIFSFIFRWLCLLSYCSHITRLTLPMSHYIFAVIFCAVLSLWILQQWIRKKVQALAEIINPLRVLKVLISAKQNTASILLWAGRGDQSEIHSLWNWFAQPSSKPLHPSRFLYIFFLQK